MDSSRAATGERTSDASGRRLGRGDAAGGRPRAGELRHGTQQELDLDRFGEVLLVTRRVRLLDIARVVIAGGISPSIEPVLKHARSMLGTDFDLPLPELVASTFGAEVVVRGAIESALTRVRREPSAFLPRTARA